LFHVGTPQYVLIYKRRYSTKYVLKSYTTNRKRIAIAVGNGRDKAAPIYVKTGFN